MFHFLLAGYKILEKTNSFIILFKEYLIFNDDCLLFKIEEIFNSS